MKHCPNAECKAIAASLEAAMKCPQCHGSVENVTRKGSNVRYDFCPNCEDTFMSARSPVDVYFERKEMEPSKQVEE